MVLRALSDNTSVHDGRVLKLSLLPDSFLMSYVHLLTGLLLTSSIALPGAATPLQITGELITSTCSVHTTGLAVHMGRVDLASVNTQPRAGRKDIRVLMDCRGSASAATIGVRFDGVTAGDTGHLALRGDASARNVAVALFSSEDIPLRVGEEGQVKLHAAAGHLQRLDFSAWYVSPGKNATAGTANAAGEMRIVYP